MMTLIKYILFACSLLLLQLSLGGCASVKSRHTYAKKPAPARQATAETETLSLQLEIQSEVAGLGEARPDTLLPSRQQTSVIALAPVPLKQINRFGGKSLQFASDNDVPFIFDIPIAYNERVRKWIDFFQNQGRSSFKKWIERSYRYLPHIERQLKEAGLPRDLGSVAMIESGFKPDAVSPSHATGLWQFIASTGSRYGLRIDWWIDERRDYLKSTRAAIGYMSDLYKLFGSWYLVAASYNMGESAVLKIMKRYSTNDFWQLADAGALPEETKNYVPKIIAATLMTKAPALYGFRNLENLQPMNYDWYVAPPGTDLASLATYLGVSGSYLQELNPEILLGYIPAEAEAYQIRVPKGAQVAALRFSKMQNSSISLRD